MTRPGRACRHRHFLSSDTPVTEIVQTEGHLIDSRLMTEIFDAVVKHGASFEVVEFCIGRTNDDFSRLQMRVSAPTAGTMQALMEELLDIRVPYSCRSRCRAPAGTDRRLRARRLLLDDQSPHVRAARRRSGSRSSGSAWTRRS